MPLENTIFLVAFILWKHRERERQRATEEERGERDKIRERDRLWRPDCADVTQMSTSASISNPAKITSSNICCSCGFSSVCQFSPSRFLSVSDLTRQANCAEPAACQVQHIDTSWGKKVNLCWQTLTTALPVWSYPRHLRWEGGETSSLQRKIRTNCQPSSETESEQEYGKVTPCICSKGNLSWSLSIFFCLLGFCLPFVANHWPLDT